MSSSSESDLWACFAFDFACVRMCDLRFVDCANLLLHESNGQTYGRSPVWIRTCVRRLKSNEKRFPQPSNVHWNKKLKIYLCLDIKGFQKLPMTLRLTNVYIYIYILIFQLSNVQSTFLPFKNTNFPAWATDVESLVLLKQQSYFWPLLILNALTFKDFPETRKNADSECIYNILVDLLLVLNFLYCLV